MIPSENASGVLNRYAPFVEYLTRQLGTKVTLRVANDYAAVIEGQRAGNIHIGNYGPSSFARALMTGAPIEAFAIEVNLDGTKGYYSVFYVRQDSAFQRIEDLKGKNLGLVDPNSTSGNNVPRFAMNRMGINPEQFFGKVVYAGSHENAVIALQPGHGRRRRQLVERRAGEQPAPHGTQGHGEGGGFPHHLQVRADRELADGLPDQPAGRVDARRSAPRCWPCRSRTRPPSSV